MPNELSMDEYLELIQLMDPDSASEIEKLKSDSPLDFNPATMKIDSLSNSDYFTLIEMPHFLI